MSENIYLPKFGSAYRDPNVIYKKLLGVFGGYGVVKDIPISGKTAEEFIRQRYVTYNKLLDDLVSMTAYQHGGKVRELMGGKFSDFYTDLMSKWSCQWPNLYSREIDKSQKIVKQFVKACKHEYGWDLQPIAGLFGEFITRTARGGCGNYLALSAHTDWRDGRFGHKHSCWWTDTHEPAKTSRFVYDEIGGVSILSFMQEDNDQSLGDGRVFSVPLGDYSIALFNAYGALDNVHRIAQRLLDILGDGFYIHSDTSATSYLPTSDMYVNEHKITIICSKEVNYPEYVSLDGDGWDIRNSNGSYYVNGKTESGSAQEEYRCAGCDDYYYEDDMHLGVVVNGHEVDLCNHCFDNEIAVCSGCNKVFWSDDSDFTEVYTITSDGRRYSRYVCQTCLESKNTVQCNYCEDYYEIAEGVSEYKDYYGKKVKIAMDDDGNFLCHHCCTRQVSRYHSCTLCGSMVYKYDSEMHDVCQAAVNAHGQNVFSAIPDLVEYRANSGYYLQEIQVGEYEILDITLQGAPKDVAYSVVHIHQCAHCRGYLHGFGGHAMAFSETRMMYRLCDSCYDTGKLLPTPTNISVNQIQMF